MEVRLATDHDAPSVREIYQPYVESSAISFEIDVPTLEEVRARMKSTSATYPWLIADSPEGALGYAYARPFAERSAYRWSAETSIYLREDVLGRGIGTLLYGTLLGLLGEQRFHQAFAGVALPNEPSVRLHEKMEFEPVALFARVGWKFDSWRDVQWWQRPLGDGSHGVPAEPLRVCDLDPSVIDRLLGAERAGADEQAS